jgi:hypothetical protein
MASYGPLISLSTPEIKVDRFPLISCCSGIMYQATGWVALTRLVCIRVSIMVRHRTPIAHGGVV